ncbi:ribonuclease HI [Schaalia sp. 19OD2882]|uniref:ribonuclease H family protein n=1 Tax=Schaalia sp. 19OD2882 TaxID=2794089 RepID=UPI001C1EDE67|nr:ribonuclease H [Schaalia sp. 19OD2882]QWW20773.1 ribonuclease HI [Schaalia sp. 19OD2882]
MTITAAVDGSALGNPGPAGWAWVVSEDCWDAGGWDHATNNIGELTAVLELLRATAAAGLADEPLHVLADSQYAINVVSKWRPGWKKRGWTKADKQPIKNLDLVKEIDRAIQGRTVTFEWVKGHAGHPMNERADDLARACAEAFRDGRVPPGGPGFAKTSAPGDEGETSSLPAAPTPALVTAEDVRAAHTRFIRAWVAGETAALTELAAPGCHRVWPQGRITEELAGSAPTGLKVGGMDVREVAPGAWLVCHRSTWAGGSSFDSSLWTAAPGLKVVHVQSTMLA